MGLIVHSSSDPQINNVRLEKWVACSRRRIRGLHIDFPENLSYATPEAKGKDRA